jgi:hypothetical protein
MEGRKKSPTPKNTKRTGRTSNVYEARYVRCVRRRVWVRVEKSNQSRAASAWIRKKEETRYTGRDKEGGGAAWVVVCVVPAASWSVDGKMWVGPTTGPGLEVSISHCIRCTLYTTYSIDSWCISKLFGLEPTSGDPKSWQVRLNFQLEECANEAGY